VYIAPPPLSPMLRQAPPFIAFDFPEPPTLHGAILLVKINVTDKAADERWLAPIVLIVYIPEPISQFM